MKKVLLLILLFTFHFSLFTQAQSWQWARETISRDSDAFGDLWGDHGLVTDNAGNSYLTGFFEDSISFGPVTLHAVQNAWNDCVFLVKYDKNGNFIWAKQSTSSPNSHGYGSSVVEDRAGNVYITGWFTDTITFGATTLIGDSLNASMFLVKYDPAGNVMWAKKYGGNQGYIISYSMAIDEAGKLYVTGYFEGTVNLGSQILSSRNDNAFVAKFDGNGSLIWAKQPVNNNSRPNFTYGLSIASGPQCNIYITGLFKDTTRFGPFALYSPNYSNVFLVKYDSSGNVQWASQSQYKSNSSGNSVMVDGQGNPYITGNFIDSIYFDNTLLTSVPNYTIFLVKYSPLGKVIWAKQNYNLSSSGWNLSTLGTDTLPAGGGYIAFSGSQGPQYKTSFLGNTFNLTSNYTSAIIFTRFDSAGDYLCGTIFTEGLEDDCEAVGVSPSGKYVCLGGDIFDTTIMGPDTLTYGLDMPFVALWDMCTKMLTTIYHTNNVSCNGLCNGQATANAYVGVPPYTYHWSNDSITKTITNLCAGTYWVVVNDSVGNKDSLTVVITQPTALTTTTSKKNILCFGDTDGSANDSTRGGTAPYSYLWSSSQTLQNIEGLSAGTYTLTVTDAHGCTIIDSVIIKEPPPIDLNMSSLPTACPYDSGVASVSASGGTHPFKYSWSNGSSNSAISGLSGGTYSVTVSDSNGCTETANTTVAVTGIPSDTACCSTTITNGQSTSLKVYPDTSGNTYYWFPSNSLSCDNCPNPVATPSLSTLYIVTITNRSGCRVEDSVFIEVNQDCQVFVPNAFSPNDDGQNDVLLVKGPCIQAMDFSIFDRWGNKVFESENINDGWNGLYQGQPMNTGTYVYTLVVLRYDGSFIKRKGSIALVR